jgi:translocation and assembly module TamA
MGYYKSKISSSIEGNSIYLNIQKNAPIKISSITLDEEFNAYSLLEREARFKTTDFTETKNKIREYLSQNGYPQHTLKAKAYVDLDEYKVDVNFSIDKGLKHYFGATELNNSSQVDKLLIKEQIVYDEGELFNVLKLEESYDNIYRLGVFEKIKMQADFNKTVKSVPMNIMLKEGETKEFVSSLGFDTEDGARGGVAYIDHNFFGNLRELKVSGLLSQRGHEAKTSYFDPRIKSSRLGDFSFLNEFGYSKWDYDAYVEGLLVERVTLGKKLFGLEHFFGFQFEQFGIESSIPAFLAGDYLINSLFYRVIIDKRDSVMDAKNGYYTSLYLEKAMKQLGSEIDYFKILAEARYIKSFDEIVLAGKIKVGTISEEIPPFKHFFLGGAMSNRGYEYRDLGDHAGIYPIGGLSVIDASFESRYYFSEELAMVGFVDSSKISQQVNDFSGQWYHSLGVGVRYLSVIGPLRLDVGYPTEGGFALHLGIGQVF